MFQFQVILENLIAFSVSKVAIFWDNFFFSKNLISKNSVLYFYIALIGIGIGILS